MFVRFTQDYDQFIFNAKKGQIVDVPKEHADLLLAQRVVVAVDHERAIKDLYPDQTVKSNRPTKPPKGNDANKPTDPAGKDADLFS